MNPCCPVCLRLRDSDKTAYCRGGAPLVLAPPRGAIAQLIAGGQQPGHRLAVDRAQAVRGIARAGGGALGRRLIDLAQLVGQQGHPQRGDVLL